MKTAFLSSITWTRWDCCAATAVCLMAVTSLYGCCHLATIAICVLTAAFLLLARNGSCNHEINPIKGVWF